jgi:polyvinyl alcohol dehydrogenase (cytochrome)
VRRVLLVTAREYRRMTSLPAFWITALLVPVFVLAAPVAQSLLGGLKTVGYVVVDKSGEYRAPISRRVELAYQRQVLVQLLAYAAEWRTSSNIPTVQAAPRAGSSLTDSAVETFAAAGGAPQVLQQLKPRLISSAPPFKLPQRPLVEIPLPNGVVTDNADQFGASIGNHFHETTKTAGATVELAIAVYIPDNIDAGGQVRVWTDSPASAELVQDLRTELTESLRLDALRSAGVDPLSAVQINTLSAPISMSAPEAPTSSEASGRSIVPLALAYLLLASTVFTGSMMLQGLIEERSNKLLEAMLACVSPRELMAGKLVGISAIGLSIVAIWVSAVVAIVNVYPSSPLGFLVPALSSLRQTPWTVVGMGFYFLAGYLVIGMIFLAVGLLSDSMQDAQGYLTPLVLIIALPSAGLASLIYRDPNGVVPRIFSWIPLYAPVVMLARLHAGVSRLDLFGSGAMLLAFGSLELIALRRLFDDHVIQTGSGHDFHLAAHARRGILVALALTVVAIAITLRSGRTPTQGDDQIAVMRSRGEGVFNATCAGCHDPAVGRAPSREQLASLAPADIASSLTSGTMKPMAATLDNADVRAVATYLTGHPPSIMAPISPDPPPCPKSAAFVISTGDWSGWSVDPRNWRFQAHGGITLEEIPRLEVKWAFSYGGGNYGQPTLVGGRLFITSRSGSIYSLDAKTGCMFWRFSQSTPSRTTVSVGPQPRAPSGYAAYFGDTSANVYSVDAVSGALLWRTRVDSHPRAALTGSPTLFEGRLYVPVSSYEEGVASLAGYSCCTFRGSVVALDAATGEIRWTAFAIPHAPAPSSKNSIGTQLYGPAGAAVWSSPTIDAKRGRLYFATGNSYTDVKEEGSDAVVAVELLSGRTIWRRQVTADDNDLSGCTGGRRLVNCPTTRGYDYDFGASPIVVPLSRDNDILAVGQKSGNVFGISPESGEVMWQTRVGVGGFLGGVQWGMASDGQRIYVANADAVVAENGRPGLFALDAGTGKDLWYSASPKVGCGWGDKLPCFNTQSAAPFAMPGVVFAGTTDGHERAYRATDGHIFWDFDTAGGTYRTTNGVDHQAGGAIDVSSGTLGDGMLYVISGYRGFLGGGSDNVLLAFSVDGR